MERIQYMEDVEIVLLSSEEIETLIDLECANEGVRLLPPMPTAPVAIEAKPNVRAYCVNGVLFTDEKKAQAVADLINASMPHETYYLIPHKWSGPQGVKPCETETTVRTEMYWSAENYGAHATVVTAYEKEKKDFDEQNREYDRVRDARGSISEEVWSTYHGALKRKRVKERMLVEFDEYVTLAEGNREQAFKFMAKARPDLDNHDGREMVGLPVPVALPVDIGYVDPTNEGDYDESN